MQAKENNYFHLESTGLLISEKYVVDDRVKNREKNSSMNWETANYPATNKSDIPVHKYFAM